MRERHICDFCVHIITQKILRTRTFQRIPVLFAGAKETIVLNFRKRDCLTSCSLQTDFITRILPDSTKNSPNASAQKLQMQLQAARLQEVFWADRIRTCGMRAPKARVLPLDDGPIYHKETFSLPYRRFLHDQHYTHPEFCPESHF